MNSAQIFIVSCSAFYTALQVHPEGKFVVDLDKNIEMSEVQSNCRVALRNDSYKLHKILPNKVKQNPFNGHLAPV